MVAGRCVCNRGWYERGTCTANCAWPRGPGWARRHRLPPPGPPAESLAIVPVAPSPKALPKALAQRLTKAKILADRLTLKFTQATLERFESVLQDQFKTTALYKLYAWSKVKPVLEAAFVSLQIRNGPLRARAKRQRMHFQEQIANEEPR